jgi:hypothetical protein
MVIKGKAGFLTEVSMNKWPGIGIKKRKKVACHFFALQNRETSVKSCYETKEGKR